MYSSFSSLIVAILDSLVGNIDVVELVVLLEDWKSDT